MSSRRTVDDLSALSLDVLARRTPHVLGRLTQIVLWTSSSAERFEQAAPLMQELARTTTRDASTRALLSQLYAYLLQVLKDVDGDKRTVNFLKLQGRKDERTL